VNETRSAARRSRTRSRTGIVFIDEIDKVASRFRRGEGGAEVSRQGVQRDLLPLVEGTRCHQVRASVPHTILFIAAARSTSPSQRLIPELQGVSDRVELKSSSVQDFEAILTTTLPSRLVKQYRPCSPPKG
jgi:ATP-dependent HslUV protease ATP-binding subunit HslU